ncbi:Isocitrate dehydrogenase [NAD] catalytic subunit 5, mitochondrial [Stylosanthes scabra]|uniref:Isocitrate dehydrogenase [NAD] catalytic subunit 5, mitochondrial n=1 Tax=Stylosanthes scabra TaxID=79078 RepID=A0ABU6TFD3_9FABA|nr:Isocitrate dehydrogenase [NAD] catalytic subunit 5, mitochondrial [Stylosanthes scabra]
MSPHCIQVGKNLANNNLADSISNKLNQKQSDALFVKCCREVAEKYPEIKYEEVVIENCWMMLPKSLALFDVLVMPNLCGDIISDLCGDHSHQGIALAEAVHGSAPDIAGKNLANPAALLLSGISMLHHLNHHDKADKIQSAILSTIAEGKYRTADLGGKAKTTEFNNAIIDNLWIMLFFFFGVFGLCFLVTRNCC